MQDYTVEGTKLVARGEYVKPDANKYEFIPSYALPA
jgi:hypothetical protein